VKNNPEQLIPGRIYKARIIGRLGLNEFLLTINNSNFVLKSHNKLRPADEIFLVLDKDKSELITFIPEESTIDNYKKQYN